MYILCLLYGYFDVQLRQSRNKNKYLLFHTHLLCIIMIQNIKHIFIFETLFQIIEIFKCYAFKPKMIEQAYLIFFWLVQSYLIYMLLLHVSLLSRPYISYTRQCIHIEIMVFLKKHLILGKFIQIILYRIENNSCKIYNHRLI